MEKIKKLDVPLVTETRTDEMSREEWLRLRLKGIGGSDAGAVMGMSPWSSAFMVYMDKKGFAPEQEDNDAMAHGRRMEPVLRKEFPELFKEETGVEVEVFTSPYLYHSKRHPFMLANIDGIVNVPYPGHTLADGQVIEGDGLLEIKTADSFMRKAWADGQVPDSYYAQVQHYLHVLELSWAILPVLIGRHFTYRIVLRDDDFIDQLINAESLFWEGLLEDSPPDPQGLDNEDAYLLHQFGEQDDEAIVSLDPRLVEKYLFLDQREKELTAEKDQVKNLLKAAMENAKVGIAGDHKVTWSRFERSSFERERFEKDYPGVYEKYCKKSMSSRFTVR